MSQFVDIPVKCISEECKNCEDLEIEIDRICGYESDHLVFMQNNCFCKNYPRCERLMEQLRESEEGGNK